jgi:glycine C-acetyltransferase
VEVDSRRLIMIGSNDYLGFTHDPRVIEASAAAARRWGSGPGGSRFLCGNATLHDELEERLSAFVGKKKAVIHTTGFATNLGSIGCLARAGDVILCDRENHASILEGCRSASSRVSFFKHNDAPAARRKLAAATGRSAKSNLFLITEGVFSMSGDIAPLPDFVAIKEDCPDLVCYLDDAHGLGVMGPRGEGTACHFGVTRQIDFIMGTFSKAMASIGGFIASDDDDLLNYLRHHSSSLIFSAALPASCAAAVLKCLDILQTEPEHLARLRRITRQVYRGYRSIGLRARFSGSAIIPVFVGDEFNAYAVSRDLFDQGVFAPPAVYPAVPRGRAVIRTAFMSTHTEAQIARVLDVFDRMAAKHGIRQRDGAGVNPVPAESEPALVV